MTTQQTFIILLLMGLSSTFIIYGQENHNFCKSFNQAQIDSLVLSIDRKEKYVEVIADGLTMKNGKNNGGFTTFTLIDSTNKLIRIRNQESTGRNTRFYYDNDKIVFATISLEEWNSNKSKTIYVARYYFNNDKLLISFGENSKYSNVIDILKEGNNYLVKYTQELKEDEELYKH